MNARRLVIAGLALAVLIAVIAVVFDQLAVRPAQTTAQNSSSASPSAAGPSPTGSGEAGAGLQSSGSPTSGPSAGGDGNGGASPGAKPLEVLPPVTVTPTGLPEPSAAAPLLKGKLPDPGNATGAVVDGWPSNVLTLPEGTTIGSTSVSGSGDVLQVTADGVVGKPQQAVIEDFRASLVPHGFWSEEAPAPDGATAARFVRGTDTITVSVATTGTGNSRFQLLGSLHSDTE